MAWKIYDEAVDMVQQRWQYFPSIFGWRGRRHEIESIECSWLARGQPARRFFRVRCAEGVFELYQNLGAGTWHLRRARLREARPLAARCPAPAWR